MGTHALPGDTPRSSPASDTPMPPRSPLLIPSGGRPARVVSTTAVLPPARAPSAAAAAAAAAASAELARFLLSFVFLCSWQINVDDRVRRLRMFSNDSCRSAVRPPASQRLASAEGRGCRNKASRTDPSATTDECVRALAGRLSSALPRSIFCGKGGAANEPFIPELGVAQERVSAWPSASSGRNTASAARVLEGST